MPRPEKQPSGGFLTKAAAWIKRLLPRRSHWKGVGGEIQAKDQAGPPDHARGGCRALLPAAE